MMDADGLQQSKFLVAIRGTLALAFCALAGWQTVVVGGSWWLADIGMPQAALSLNPSLSVANDAMMLAAMSTHDLPSAQTYAVASLRASPIDQEALTGAALSGNPSQTAPLMNLSAGLGWRDLQTQLYLVQQSIQRGAADVFAQRFDAYQRQAPGSASVLPLLDRYIADASVRAAITRRLAAQPGWRSDYLQRLMVPDPRVIAGREALLIALEDSAAPVLPTELLSYVTQLNRAGFPVEAHRVWIRFVAHRDAWSGYVYDGSFKYVQELTDPFPYEWSLSNTAGAFATPETMGTGHALHIQSDGASNGPLVTEVLWLAPGDYRLVVHATAGDDIIEGGENYPFEWSVLCDDVRELLSSPDGEGTPAGAGIRTYSFRVPQDCPSPTLSLNSASGDGNTSHSLWITNVRIDQIA